MSNYEVAKELALKIYDCEPSDALGELTDILNLYSEEEVRVVKNHEESYTVTFNGKETTYFIGIKDHFAENLKKEVSIVSSKTVTNKNIVPE